jgi:hypothetical protein
MIGYYNDHRTLVGSIFFIKLGKRVLAYDLEQGKQIYTIAVEGNDSIIHSEKHFIMLTSENEVVVFNPQTGDEVLKLPIESYPNYPEIVDNKLIAMPRDDKHSIGCWNLDTGVLEKIYYYHHEIENWKIAEDRLFVLTEDDKYFLYDVKDYKEICEKSVEDYQRNQIKVFRHDNNIIVRIHSDTIFVRYTTFFWDVGKGVVFHLGDRSIRMYGTRLVLPTKTGYIIYDLNYVPAASLGKRIKSAIKSIFV